LGTQFQDAVVFCPKCEDLGMDVPVMMPGPCKPQAAEDGALQLRCHCCRHDFCGVCRSPCHPGKSCFSEASQVKRMTKRRPPLPPKLHDAAVAAASEVKQKEKRKHQEFQAKVKTCMEDFDSFRKTFQLTHEKYVKYGLRAVFPQGVELTPAPLAPEVSTQFMRELQKTDAEIRPALHGTDAKNYESIWRRGLLVPGVNNELKIVHGAAHGQGVYVANVDAAWLSKGFCTEQSMLVCAVLHTGEVWHVRDAMIAGRAELVAPLFLAREASGNMSYVRESELHKQPEHAKAGAAASGSEKEFGKTPKAESKSSKFKARLAAKSQRH